MRCGVLGWALFLSSCFEPAATDAALLCATARDCLAGDVCFAGRCAPASPCLIEEPDIAVAAVDGVDCPAGICVRGQCVPPRCGDGIRAENERCDGEPDCRPDCTRCGDGIVDADEACDSGVGNSDERGNACRTNCALPFCGDGVVDDGEACDDGDANDDLAADACRSDCQRARCGDGVVDDGEVCDDGGTVNGDGCRADCRKIERCGDGQVDEGEACDDGNTNPKDGCDERCTATVLVARRVLTGQNVDVPAATVLSILFGGPVIFDPDGRLIIAEVSTGLVWRIDEGDRATLIAGAPNGRTPATGLPANSVRLAIPEGANLAFDNDGRLLVPSSSHIVRIEAVGTITVLATAPFGGFDGFRGVAVSRAGELFVTTLRPRHVSRVAPDGSLIPVIGDGGTFRVDQTDGPALAAGLTVATGLAFDEQDRLHVVDRDTAVRRLDPDGVLRRVAPPGQLAIDGSSLVVGRDGSVVRVTDGVETVLMGGGAAGVLVGAPSDVEVGFVLGVAVGPHGELAVTESLRLRVLDAGVVRLVAAPDSQGPRDEGLLAETVAPRFSACTYVGAELWCADSRSLRAIDAAGRLRTVLRDPFGFVRLATSRDGVVGGVRQFLLPSNEIGYEAVVVAPDGSTTALLPLSDFPFSLGGCTSGTFLVPLGTQVLRVGPDVGEVEVVHDGPDFVVGAACTNDGAVLVRLGRDKLIARASPSGDGEVLVGGGATRAIPDSGLPALEVSLNSFFGFGIDGFGFGIDGEDGLVVGDDERILRATDGVINVLVGGRACQLQFGQCASGIDGDGASVGHTAFAAGLAVALDGRVSWNDDASFRHGFRQQRRRERAADGALRSLTGGVRPTVVGQGAERGLLNPRALGALDDALLAVGEGGFALAVSSPRSPAPRVDVAYGYDARLSAPSRRGHAAFAPLLTAPALAVDSARRRVALVEAGASEVIMVDALGDDPGAWPVQRVSLAAPLGTSDGAVLFGDELTIGDGVGGCVERVNVASGARATLAGVCGRPGTRTGLLKKPASVARSPLTGAIYIADAEQHRVFRIEETPLGVTQTLVVGDGSRSLAGLGAPARDFPVDAPRQLVVDTHGNLFVAANGAVRVVVNVDGDLDADGDDEVLTVRVDADARCLGAASLIADDVYVADTCSGALFAVEVLPAP